MSKSTQKTKNKVETEFRNIGSDLVGLVSTLFAPDGKTGFSNVKPATTQSAESFYTSLWDSLFLKTGQLHTGEVINVDYTTKTVTVRAQDVVIPGCIYVAGTMATFFGLENASLPPVGATVLFYYATRDTPSLILGTLGNRAPVYKAMPEAISGQYKDDNARVAKTEGLKNQDESDPPYVTFAQGVSMPSDLVAGEMNLTVGAGPMIRLLHNFAQLGASDAAKVEACLLNDMVRIVDNYFVHHTCGGDELVWGAGSCTKEEHFTGYAFEAEGKLKKNDALCEAERPGIYDPAHKLESVTGDTGRWRMSKYIGFLGDMIHKWVTTPTEVASNIMENALRAGQFKSWIGSDGTYCVQAAGGIQLEVTQYIVIPEILKAWNDPDFDMEAALTNLDAEFLKVWGNGPDWTDLKVACWQLQYYTKYLSIWHSLARFRQLSKHKFCKIPAEAELPERTPVAAEEDKANANPTAVTRQPGHALLSMDPAGNIALRSNDHTSITMYNGNLQIACPGNLELKAGGIVTMQGNTVSIRGAQRVEITSIFGTLVTTARTAWKALCELGTVWIKGDGRKDTELPKNELQERIDKLGQEEREFAEFAVVLDAAKGKTLVHGHQGVVLNTKDKAGHITMQADGPDSHINMHATSDIRMYAGRRIFMKAASFISRITDGIYFLKCAAINFMDALTIQKGVVHANQIKGNTISAYDSFIGRQDKVTKLDQKTLDEYYIPDLKTPALMAADKGEDEEPTISKKADKVITEQMKLQFKTSFDWENLYSEFSDNMDFCLYEAPYEADIKCDPDRPAVQFTLSEIQETKTGKNKAPRTQWIVYPQKYNKQVTSVSPKDKDILLGHKPWEKDFTKDDIKGIKDMRTVEYTYAFTKPPVKN